MFSPFILEPSLRKELRERIDEFPTPDMRRGQEYFRQERVKQLQALGSEKGESGFQAKVQGTRRYNVEWMHDEEGWISTCTCPLGGNCKHAYAAAMAMLRSVTPPTEGEIAPTVQAVDSARASRLEHPEAQKLVELLETRHHRMLSSKERAFVRELVLFWSRCRNGAAIYPRDLHALGLGETGYYFNDPKPVFADWRDAIEAAESPLEFWQFLALYAERNKTPIPEVMRPVTDTSVVRSRVEASERQHEISRWRERFEVSEDAVAPVQAELPPHAVRLRFTAPKLTWEFRSLPDAPWQLAKGGKVRDWFDAIALNPGAIEPASLALLQEVQLRRSKSEVWNTTEAQTLRLSDESTRELLRWMLPHPVLRHLLVDSAGIPFDAAPVRLQWLGRPVPEQPEDVAFDLVREDGTPAPRDLLELNGEPPLALSGRTIFQLPAPLAAGAPRGVIVPKEALGVRTKLRLHRQGVKFEGVNLPPIEEIRLRARFVCALSEAELGALETLDVQLEAVAPDGALVQRWDGVIWTKIKSPVAQRSADSPIHEYDLSAGEAARAHLDALGLLWDPTRQVWTRRSSAKGFPEEFASWAENVRGTGVDLLCDPLLAGLSRPPDLARLDVQAAPVGDESAGIDWFDLQIAVRAEDRTLTEEEVRLLLKARGRFVRLPGKGWRRLQLELDQKENDRLAELGVEVDQLDGPLEHQRFHALQLADERIAGLLPAVHAAKVRERAERLREAAPPSVPPTLQAELRPYQIEGYHFLAHLSINGLGGVLADDMGLGKTVQALAWVLWLIERAKGSQRPWRALVVCPKSVVSNWEREAGRFAPSLVVAALSNRAQLPAEANLIIANYAQLRLAAPMLSPVTWDALILDEGQNIKNPQSQTARVARELRAAHRVVLTGTPIENRALDLWSLFAFAMPGLLGSQASFKRSFNDRVDPLARSRLARRVRHFMLRRTKAQVAADLPPRIEEDLFVDLDGVQRKLYDAELKRARSMLLGVTNDREFDRQRFNILQSLLRLRQICCDPRLLGVEEGVKRTLEKGEHRKETSGVAGSAKLEALFDTLEPLVEEGHRVLVFSQFVSMLELISAELRTRNIQHLMLTGQTENRQTLVDRFQSDEGEPVFLLSLKAAGTGLNLTAASYVVLFDPWWNPAVEAQAIDRTHRIGQKNQVIAYRLLARNTIEEKIRQLQQAKSELARAIVQENAVATVMSIDDLRFVLGE